MNPATATRGGTARPATSFPEAQLDAWRALCNAHAALMGRMEESLAEEQLPPLGWYDVLWALDRAPDQTLRPRDLGLHLTISKSGLTRLVDRIVAAGLIERRECRSDRRGHLIALTDAGRSMLHEMWPVYAEAFNDHFASRLTKDQAKTLAALLEQLREQACAGVGEGDA
jgi:DNA-binding MarR family transcriptional regulator